MGSDDKRHAAPLTRDERGRLATRLAIPKTWRGSSWREETRCGARARSTGKPCQAKALKNGRCRNHGGMSTGPRTEAGKARCARNLPRNR
jgi:hypothetical protein